MHELNPPGPPDRSGQALLLQAKEGGVVLYSPSLRSREGLG